MPVLESALDGVVVLQKIGWADRPEMLHDRFLMFDLFATAVGFSHLNGNGLWNVFQLRWPFLQKNLLPHYAFSSYFIILVGWRLENRVLWLRVGNFHLSHLYYTVSAFAVNASSLYVLLVLDEDGIKQISVLTVGVFFGTEFVEVVVKLLGKTTTQQMLGW